MANMELIYSYTVPAGGVASVTLPATGTIPQTYKDLKLVFSARTTNNSTRNSFYLYPNNSSSNNANKLVFGYDSTTPGVVGGSDASIGWIDGALATTGTFANGEVYIPNYTSTTIKKSYQSDIVAENNSTSSWILNMGALYWNDTTAITTIRLFPDAGNLAEGSSFYLYGIPANASSKATGGVVSTDGTYWYHVFGSSGVFTPTTALSADVLCIAGGGGGGRTGGGGGAGGLRALTSQSMTATAYAITIGAGGIGNNTDGQKASNGTNSSIIGTGLSISSTGGGGASSYGGGTGLAGGSGGGGSGGGSYAGGAGNAGSYSPVEGYAGGTGGSDYDKGGGGGGAGAVGNNANSGSGGIGATSALLNAMGTITSTGQLSSGNYYYAGGGGAAQGNAGGLGGGGAANSNGPGTTGTINTGGGGGAGGGNNPPGAQGGSGLVIIRYAI